MSHHDAHLPPFGPPEPHREPGPICPASGVRLTEEEADLLLEGYEWRPRTNPYARPWTELAPPPRLLRCPRCRAIMRAHEFLLGPPLIPHHEEVS